MNVVAMPIDVLPQAIPDMVLHATSFIVTFPNGLLTGAILVYDLSCRNLHIVISHITKKAYLLYQS